MKSLLVPFDFSESANYALDIAAEIAKVFTADIEVLFVIESTESSFNTMGIADVQTDDDIGEQGLYWKAASRRLNEIINQEKYSGIDITPKVVVGKPFELLSEEINKIDPELVVMGTNGSSGLDEILVGSNTEKVVRYSKAPVLSIPNQVHIDKVDKIVFALNGAKNELNAIKAIEKFREYMDAKLYLLWVNTPHIIESEEVKEDILEGIAKENGLENYEVFVRRNITAEHGILNFANEIEADLIALPTNSRKGLAYLFSGSLAEDIVNRAVLPVWTYSIANNKK